MRCNVSGFIEISSLSFTINSLIQALPRRLVLIIYFLTSISTRNLTDSYKTLNNGLVADYKGNAYVTNSAKTSSGKWIMTPSPLSNSQPLLAEADASFHDFGLNGIVYNSEGYLLLVLVVRATHGRCLRSAKKPGRQETGRDTVVVVSQKKLWFVQSQDNIDIKKSEPSSKTLKLLGFRKNMSTRIVNLKRRNKEFLCRE
ncbi:hypothetical protein IGI04_001949 [Brassica rapa subsp. trilocularis]|uniref:Strictosidine synthase conserved region domain-containing protein n=1 Tax=Brassica rapa subsp. trilocularis TaxID=1813537 RepID=A0ABQ7NU65_BRACM|nr:hypothetical protein IGI04_001949 [Brassica rapa subsp. trilocularis]